MPSHQDRQGNGSVRIQRSTHLVVENREYLLSLSFLPSLGPYPYLIHHQVVAEVSEDQFAGVVLGLEELKDGEDDRLAPHDLKEGVGPRFASRGRPQGLWCLLT